MKSSTQRMILAFLSAMFLLSSQAVSAFEEGDILVRLRGMWVHPFDDSSAATGALVSGTYTVESDLAPEFDGTYMLTKEIGIELIAAATRHDFTGAGVLAAAALGRTWMIPATLLAQWHFHFSDKLIPYIGVGMNFSYFFNEKNYLTGATGISLKNSWGIAGQFGADYMVSDNSFINLDVKYIDIDTIATLTGATAGTIKIDVNPWLIALGCGHRF